MPEIGPISSRDPVSSSEMIGQHLLADFWSVPTQLLKDGATLTSQLVDVLQHAGFHVLQHHWHAFPEPSGGVTAFVLLSQSHAAVHTYPEHEYLGLDIFSCGEADPRVAVKRLQQLWQPASVDVSVCARGTLGSMSHGQ